MHNVTTNEDQHQKRRPITCHGCAGTAASGCGCLTPWTIVRKMREASERLFVKGADPARSRQARAEHRRMGRARLQALAAQAEQQAREYVAFAAFTRALPANEVRALELLMSDALNGNQIRFGEIEWAARAAKLTIAEVKDLRDRCLHAMQSWPADFTEADAWAQEQARFEEVLRQSQTATDGPALREVA